MNITNRSGNAINVHRSFWKTNNAGFARTPDYEYTKWEDTRPQWLRLWLGIYLEKSLPSSQKSGLLPAILKVKFGVPAVIKVILKAKVRILVIVQYMPNRGRRVKLQGNLGTQQCPG